MITSPAFYVTGGTVPRDAPSYVPRRADEELLDGLRRGEFCYVLTSRQMGKSSLMVRTATRLRQEGVACVVLDLTAIGQNLSEEQWYDGLLNLVAVQLYLEKELEAFWFDHGRLGPLQRWMAALQNVVLKHCNGRIVIFVDEIDAVRSLPFSADEFFAGIRECYNRRTEDPEFQRISFCLLGVATPSDLIRDTRNTPFNIGRRIDLTDFTESEAAPLAEGLPGSHSQQAASLRRILYWTNGHPYLTQRLCQAVAESPLDSVDSVCESLFLSSSARERDDNLLFVRERLLRSEVDLAGLLDLYSKVRVHGVTLERDQANKLVEVLRLSGIVCRSNGHLINRNRIYERVFDSVWIRSNMPDAEVRRQAAAYKRGLLRVAAIAGVSLFFPFFAMYPMAFVQIQLRWIMVGLILYFAIIWLLAAILLSLSDRHLSELSPSRARRIVLYSAIGGVAISCGNQAYIQLSGMNSRPLEPWEYELYITGLAVIMETWKAGPLYLYAYKRRTVTSRMASLYAGLLCGLTFGVCATVVFVFGCLLAWGGLTPPTISPLVYSAPGPRFTNVGPSQRGIELGILDVNATLLLLSPATAPIAHAIVSAVFGLFLSLASRKLRYAGLVLSAGLLLTVPMFACTFMMLRSWTGILLVFGYIIILATFVFFDRRRDGRDMN